MIDRLYVINLSDILDGSFSKISFALCIFAIIINRKN